MDLKATIGMCRKVDYEEKMIIVPQNSDILEDNQIVMIISAEEFIKLANNAQDVIKFVETVQEMEDE